MMTWLKFNVLLTALVMCVGAQNAASASTTTYDLVGVTLTFGSNVDTVTGSFTVDSSSPYSGLVNITITGPVYADNYLTPYYVGPTYVDAVGIDPNDSLLLFFNLGTGSNPLISASGGDVNGGVTADAVTGSAVVTPLPAALPLFATGLGAMGLIGWRRKRKAQGVCAS